MVQETTNKFKLIFLLIYFPVTLARYNVYRSRYLEPHQDYYNQEESYPGYYQNDDMAKCPAPYDESNWPLTIESGFNTEVYPAYGSNSIVMYRSENNGFASGGGAGPSSARAKIRQKFDVEPPTVCPVLEVELYSWNFKILCYLMWDEFTRSDSTPNYHPTDFTYIHTKCPATSDPEEIDNPKRIFTLIPYVNSKCDIMSDRLGCLRYKLCPFQNTSCEAPVLALAELGAHPRISVQVPKTGRTYNLGGYSVFKRQAYYEYYDSSLDSYQNDDACLSSMTGILSFDLNGKRCLFPYVFENAVIMYPEYGSSELGYCNSDPNTIFTLEVRQIYEPAPPNPCPVIEAEIRFRTDLTDVKCALLWDQGGFGGNKLQDFIRPECTALESPESSADNNPYRIFTLTAQPGTSIINEKNFVDYKLCPGQNMSCGEMVVIATQFDWVLDVRE